MSAADSDNFLEGFATNLRRLIASRPMSSAEVAERSDVSPGRIQAASEGRAELGAIEILRLAAVLEVPPRMFFEDLDLATEGD